LDSLKNLKVSNFDGKDINRVVSMVRGAVLRLKKLKDPRTQKSSVPEDLATTLLEVFQTTSVDKFNELFTYLEKSSKVQYFKTGATALPPVKEILQIAEIQYRELISTDNWTGVMTKSKVTVLLGTEGTRQPTACWNYNGVGHTTKECTKVQDPASKIKTNGDNARKKWK
jgi:hypothetical protein